MVSPSWDNYFMTMVYLVASKSKDDRTHMGAIVVGPKKEIRTTGYNSFPRGIDDKLLERQKKGEKEYWFEHAERNAIYNATLMGTSLLNCVLYVNGIPCMDCARAVIQSGIKEVVVDESWDVNHLKTDAEKNKKSIIMFDEAGIKLRYHKPKYVKITRVNDGLESELEY